MALVFVILTLEQRQCIKGLTNLACAQPTHWTLQCILFCLAILECCAWPEDLAA